jgi:hypothetical protein
MQHDSDATKRYCLSAADANTKYKTNGQATTCQNDGLGGKLAMQVYESKCRKFYYRRRFCKWGRSKLKSLS